MFGEDGLCSLRWNHERDAVEVIDQTALPHTLRLITLDTLPAFCHAISTMQVRGAPLIGITAAFGLAHALASDPSEDSLQRAYAALLATRPTAVNLRWALDQVVGVVANLDPEARGKAALEKAGQLREADISSCERIAAHGYDLLEHLYTGETLHVMTHCNAGWLATVQWGTALAPVYKAHANGLPVHVWVSETRPRNQGLSLTAWELHRAGIDCTVVADNSCGQLMREGRVDCVIVGSDRTAANGDVCNKVGTYLKALAAQANNVPFYVALPASTIDWQCESGASIPIEERDSTEVLTVSGLDETGNLKEVRLAAEQVAAHNPAFDITPAELVSALVTEEGVFTTDAAGMSSLGERVSTG